MQKVKISKVCKISNGFAFKSDKYVSSDGARVIRITNVQKGKIVDNDPRLYPFSEVKNLENYKINEGDIMMSLTGNVGRVGKFPKELLPAFINQRVCRIKSNTEKLSDDYLFHFLNSNKFENDAVRNSAGAAQLNLSTNWLAEYEIPLPNLATQQKITKILDKADELRQYNQQIVAKYDALTQSLFLDMFGDMAHNHSKFAQVPLIDLVADKHDIKCGPFGTQLSKSEYVEFGVPIWGIPQINSRFEKKPTEYITTQKAEILKQYSVLPNDLIMSRKGNVGKCAIYPNWEMGILHSDALRIRCDKDKISPIFLAWQFRISRSLETQVNDVSSGAIMAGINVSKLKNIQPIVPPIELQNQFAERVQLIEAQKQQAQEALAKSELLFQGLLQQAFNGELI
jgi:type I restriction enzyme S subunit